MKNIFKLLSIFIVAGILFVSCEKIPYFQDNSRPADANVADYYLQFINAAKTAETGVTVSGELVEVQSSIAVVIMGMPQSQDITVNITLDPASTLAADMYTLSATSITIPAGQTSGSVDFSTVAANMPVGQTLTFILNMDAGAHNNPNPNATKLTYNVKRIEFCPWTAAEMVGTYTGTDFSGYGQLTMEGASFEVFLVDDTHIAVSGLCQSLYVGAWGETVTGGDRVVFEVLPNGLMTTVNQHLCETDNVWDYYMGPDASRTLKWDGCNQIITIPYIFHWDAGYADAYQCLAVMTKN